MFEILRIHVGIKLNALVVSETDDVVPLEKVTKLVADIIASKNNEVAFFKKAIELVLNTAPDYVFCAVSSIEDGLIVHLTSNFSEEEDGNYNEWLESHHTSEKRLQEVLQHYAQVVKNMALCYGRHFNGNLVLSVEQSEG